MIQSQKYTVEPPNNWHMVLGTVHGRDSDHSLEVKNVLAQQRSHILYNQYPHTQV